MQAVKTGKLVIKNAMLKSQSGKKSVKNDQLMVKTAMQAAKIK